MYGNIGLKGVLYCVSENESEEKIERVTPVSYQ